ncbi:MAG: hypothetical protein V3T15_06185 [Pseudomonadales bacterium]
MQRRDRKTARVLLLGLALLGGTLQAQTIYLCDMMDAPAQHECCCDDHRMYARQDCHDALERTSGPCCEQAVELSFNQDSEHPIKAPNSAEMRSDVDPPSFVHPAFDRWLKPNVIAILAGYAMADPAHHPDADTYLITRRLRI